MCAGGVIAYEMAKQLVSSGDKVELLVLLDAAAPNAAKRHGRIAKHRMERLSQLFAAGLKGDGFGEYKRLAQAVFRKFTNALVWEINDRLRRWTVRVRFWMQSSLLERKRQWPRFIPSLNVRQTYETAESSFVPTPLSFSDILLVRAKSGEGGDTPFVEVYADEKLGWGSLVAGLQVIDVNGGHFTMLQEPFAKMVAEAIAGRLRRNAETGEESLLMGQA
jgi:thioesterase domain-containing protein